MSSRGSSLTARKTGLLQVRACPLHTPPAISLALAVFFPRAPMPPGIAARGTLATAIKAERDAPAIALGTGTSRAAIPR